MPQVEQLLSHWRNYGMAEGRLMGCQGKLTQKELLCYGQRYPEVGKDKAFAL